MSDPILRRGAIRETRASAFAVAIDLPPFALPGDEPVTGGGGGLGPSPFDYLIAALGSCTAMTVRWYAARHSWPLDSVSVEIIHRKHNGHDHFDKIVQLNGPGLSDEQRAKLLDVAAKCPVHRTITGGQTMIETIAAAEPTA